MNIRELVFKDKKEMSIKLEQQACKYEGYISGRNGYNFSNTDGSYTIAYIQGDTLTKMHELRHAKFYFDPNYRVEVEKIWSSFTSEEQIVIEKFLSKCGYKKELFRDEFQAYWFTEKEPRKFFGLKKN